MEGLLGSCCCCAEKEPLPEVSDGGSRTDSEGEGDALEPEVKSFSVKLHSAELSRSFAKIGWMDPYAIVVLGDSHHVAGRTEPAKGAHKTPVWDADLHIHVHHLPDHITIAVWDKNNFHRDVFCGSTTVPCASDMGTLANRSYTLTKKDKPTGTITCSISVELKDGGGSAPLLGRSPTGLGPELDNLVAWTDGSAPLGSSVSFKQGDVWAAQGSKTAFEDPADDEDHHHDLPGERQDPVEHNPAQFAAPIMGKWRCVKTWGLDEFLKAQKRSFFERKTAAHAKWPDWEFKASGDKIVFLNSTMIGLLTEEIPLGTEYQNIDGQKNAWMVHATWTPSAAGGCLLQERKGGGALGQVQERRTVDGDKLEFRLTKDGVSWGRDFERA